MTKGDIINKAYSRGRISGLTVQPSPEDISIALDRLESLAAEWEEKTICAGYAFEDTPDVNTPHNLKRAYWSAFESNLMFWLLSDFGKQPSQMLAMEAAKTFNALSTATMNVNPTQYPVRMPRGSGNRRYGYRRNFYAPIASAPNDCSTVRMDIGDIRDFVEHFDSYLDLAETVASYTIEATGGLTIASDSLATPDVLYRINATGTGDTLSTVESVKIVATTSTGRVETRIVNFDLTEVTL